jgi:RNA-directed DNA polymerase
MPIVASGHTAALQTLWRCCGWTTLPRCKLYGEFGLVNLVALIPSIATQRMASS